MAARTPGPRGDVPSSIALVTGASGGIGRAVCLALARRGWRVAIHYRTRQEEAERAAAEVARRGGEAMLLQADVREAAAVDKMVRAVLDRWGRVDVLVCAAGVAIGRLVVRLDGAAWDRVVSTNLTGAFHCMRAAAESMQSRGGGSIVLIGSYAGLQGGPGQAAYAASKAGLLGLMRSAAREWGGSNIRVNVILPGVHRTAMTEGTDAGVLAPGDHLLGRTPSLEEVADGVVRLAQCRDVSGQVWNLDSRII